MQPPSSAVSQLLMFGFIRAHSENLVLNKWHNEVGLKNTSMTNSDRRERNERYTDADVFTQNLINSDNPAHTTSNKRQTDTVSDELMKALALLQLPPEAPPPELPSALLPAKESPNLRLIYYFKTNDIIFPSAPNQTEKKTRQAMQLLICTSLNLHSLRIRCCKDAEYLAVDSPHSRGNRDDSY
ncbi:hypothetical protein EYF80_006117 [Liparis tanakae]|uniref:Uncharacterized protein n=1 Tax=Liparis tanakae TaxID=230148 RepID=A0A4Z2J071_9TELE|nr:hypothetical protein EYF80_006117 [Liparis tanakae]